MGPIPRIIPAECAYPWPRQWAHPKHGREHPKKYPGALVGVRGSLGRGARFDKDTKAIAPFNKESWDVDAFAFVHHEERGRKRAGKRGQDRGPGI